MSRNFELMQSAETNTAALNLNKPPMHAPIAGDNKSNGNGDAPRLELLDKVSQEESIELVQNIFLLHGEPSPRVVVFAGIDSGNGCSSICAHVAKSLANQKLGTVCIVDANFRAPSLPEYFGVSNHFGLTDSLSKQGGIRNFAKVIGPDNLWLLSCGSLGNQSPTLLNSEAMQVRLSELRKQFDYVLIDSSPLNGHGDGLALAQFTDGVVLILEANSTRREPTIKVTENLRAARIEILGVVLNKRAFPIPDILYKLI